MGRINGPSERSIVEYSRPRVVQCHCAVTRTFAIGPAGSCESQRTEAAAGSGTEKNEEQVSGSERLLFLGGTPVALPFTGCPNKGRARRSGRCRVGWEEALVGLFAVASLLYSEPPPIKLSL